MRAFGGAMQSQNSLTPMAGELSFLRPVSKGAAPRGTESLSVTAFCPLQYGRGVRCHGGFTIGTE